MTGDKLEHTMCIASIIVVEIISARRRRKRLPTEISHNNTFIPDVKRPAPHSAGFPSTETLIRYCFSTLITPLLSPAW